MPESDIGDGSGATHDTNPSLAFPRELRHAFNDVTTVCHLHHVSSHGVGAVASDDNGWLGLVFGTGRSSSRPSCYLSLTSTFVVVVVVVVFVAVPFLCAAASAVLVFGRLG